MARIKEPGAASYHVISRIIQGQSLLDEEEKERFRRMMRAVEAFSGVRVLTYSVLHTHFHILLHVPERRELNDQEFIERLQHLYAPQMVKSIAQSLCAMREEGDDAGAERLKGKYTYRMYELSEFAKTLKQRFTQSYNRRHGRKGTLWEDRFKSLVVQGSGFALATVAAYIELNAVRAGLASDPKDYRYCGYGEAMGGGSEARRGIGDILGSLGGESGWPRAGQAYRKWIFEQGEQKGLDEKGAAVRAGFTPEKVREVLEAGGALSRTELLHCRVRYFSDGVALGSRAYVEDLFRRHRGAFSARRNSGACKMAGGDWGDLCTLRRLRLNVISLPASS
jgi:REP element-mobilizing transposase RayT